VYESRSSSPASFAKEARVGARDKSTKKENMAKKRVADVLVNTLVAAGVKRVYDRWENNPTAGAFGRQARYAIGTNAM
jgi:hypothetical protein